jgi:hypothetical protein
MLFVRRASIRPRFLALAVVVPALVFAVPGGRGHATADGAPPAPVDPASASAEGPKTARARALADLGSPFLAVRARAFDALVPKDGADRAANRAAFRSANEPLRARLSGLLATGADRDDLRALLEALASAKDPATVTALREALVAHAEETAGVVAELVAADPKAPPAWIELGEILARARVEGLFLSRKSRSGGTGSYDGQYDVLRVDRRRALEVCLAILLDTDLPRPGVAPLGRWRFLRTPSGLVDEQEVRSMAANAVAELVTPDDTGVLARLHSLHLGLLETIRSPGDPVAARVAARAALALDDVVLPTLVRNGVVDPGEVEDRVRTHRYEQDFDDAAHVRLRMGDYAAAVELYVLQIRNRGQRVIPSYNLACTYARWSAATSSKEEAKELRERAVAALRTSVEHGYPDWAWIEQDRDLVAIRETPGYRSIVADLKRRFPAPSTWKDVEPPR